MYIFFNRARARVYSLPANLTICEATLLGAAMRYKLASRLFPRQLFLKSHLRSLSKAFAFVYPPLSAYILNPPQTDVSTDVKAFRALYRRRVRVSFILGAVESSREQRSLTRAKSERSDLAGNDTPTLFLFLSTVDSYPPYTFPSVDASGTSYARGWYGTGLRPPPGNGAQREIPPGKSSRPK